MQRQSLLNRVEPFEALYHHFNVVPITTSYRQSLPDSLDMTVTSHVNTPTHVLAIIPSENQASSPPIMLPVDMKLYENGFRASFELASTPITPPVPRASTITLPVIPLSVPHVSSVALLMLYGLELETQPNILAWRLLPPQVVEEFPNAAAMAQIFSRFRDDYFDRYFEFNQGIWKNVLALGLKDTKLVTLVQTAWNVTAEARRIRQRSRR